jgi:S-adenosylmethionine synthetase
LWLSNRRRAGQVSELVGSPLRLCPDGKVLVVVEENGNRRSLKAVSCSLPARAGDIELQRAVVGVVVGVMRDIAQRVPGFETSPPEDIVVNGSGTFATGGPEGDNGLSGKKLLLDHYGPRVPIGGTALSGKDFWKPDRAGAMLARRMALAIVRAGVASEATVQFVTFPGDEAPRVTRITASGLDLPEPGRWLDLVDCRFAVAAPWCRRFDLPDGARWGWFGGDAPWEALALR